MNSKQQATVVPPIWRNALIITLIISFFFLRSFLMVIILAAVSAYMLTPIHKRLLRWTKRQALAVPLTLLSALLLVLIPLTIVLGITVAETRTIISDVQGPEFRQDINSATDSLKGVLESINDLLQRSDINYTIDRTVISEKLQNALPKILDSAVDVVTNTLGSIPRFFTLLILYIFLLGSMLANRQLVMRYVKALSPFNDRINDIYFRKISLMITAMVKGQFVIAIVQGLIGAISLWIAGIDYIFFFAVILTLLSFIPLGGGILTLPIAGVLLATGNIWQGLLVALVHFVIVTNIDGILRAKLVNKDAYLPASLMLLATFAGVGFFGLIGVIYGPIIMIFITTTLSLYISENRAHNSAARKLES